LSNVTEGWEWCSRKKRGQRGGSGFTIQTWGGVGLSRLTKKKRGCGIKPFLKGQSSVRTLKNVRNGSKVLKVGGKKKRKLPPPLGRKGQKIGFRKKRHGKS